MNMSSLRSGYLGLFLVSIFSFCAAAQQLSQRMTNQDVIEMVALRLSDDLVIEKIHSVDSADFDTSVKDLRALRAGKVSDLVIRAMITPRSTPSAGHGAAQLNPAHDLGQSPEEVGVYIMRNGQFADGAGDCRMEDWWCRERVRNLGIGQGAYQRQGCETQEFSPVVKPDRVFD
jgi:hypothetical protein